MSISFPRSRKSVRNYSISNPFSTITDSRDTDPSGGNNHITSLLDSQDGGVPLMMGVLLSAPPSIMAPDKLAVFKIEDADLRELSAKKNFPSPTPSHPEWEPDAPLVGAAQWEAVHDNWVNPVWKTGDEGQAGFVKKWVEVCGWDKAMSLLAKIPERVEARFEELYVAAPLLTK